MRPDMTEKVDQVLSGSMMILVTIKHCEIQVTENTDENMIIIENNATINTNMKRKKNIVVHVRQFNVTLTGKTSMVEEADRVLSGNVMIKDMTKLRGDPVM
jgi:hypothetical protein